MDIQLAASLLQASSSDEFSSGSASGEEDAQDPSTNSFQSQSSPHPSGHRPEQPPLLPAVDLTANWRPIWREPSFEAAPPSERLGGTPFGREDHSLCLHKGVLYLYGGWDSRQDPPIVFGDLWAMELADASGTDTASSMGGHAVSRRNQQPKWKLLFDPEQAAQDPANRGHFFPSRGRWGHTADVVGDYMVIVGGTDNTESAEFEILLFDLNTHLWHRLATYEPLDPVPCSRLYPGAADSVDDQAWREQETLKSMRPLVSSSRFNYAKYAQTLTASTRSSITGAAMSTLHSMDEGAMPTNDDTARLWSTLEMQPVKPSVRYCHSCVQFNEVLIVFGGLQNENSCTNDVLCIDIHGDGKLEKQKQEVPSTAIVSTISCSGAVPEPRFSHRSCFVKPCSMFVFGGSNAEEVDFNFDQLYELNLSSFQWSVVRPAAAGKDDGLPVSNPEGRMLHCAVADKYGLIYLFGGKYWDMREAPTEMLLYDSVTAVWRRIVYQQGPYPQSIVGMACVVNKDDDADGLRVIVSGGEDESNDAMLNDVIELRIDGGKRRALLESRKAGVHAPSKRVATPDAYFVDPAASRMPPLSPPPSGNNSTAEAVRSNPAAPVFSSVGSTSSADPTIGTYDSPRGTPPYSKPPPPPHAAPDLLAMHNWIQQLQRSVVYRFDEIDARLTDTNRRIDRLRDVFLATARGEGGLLAENQSFNAAVLQELRSMRDEQRRVMEMLARSHERPRRNEY